MFDRSWYLCHAGEDIITSSPLPRAYSLQASTAQLQNRPARIDFSGDHVALLTSLRATVPAVHFKTPAEMLQATRLQVLPLLTGVGVDKAVANTTGTSKQLQREQSLSGMCAGFTARKRLKARASGSMSRLSNPLTAFQSAPGGKCARVVPLLVFCCAT